MRFFLLVILVCSSVFAVTLEELAHQSYSVFELLRNDVGVYRDSYRFDGNQFHPSSIAATGMGLVTLCVADKMGWIDDAEAKALKSMQTMMGQTDGYTPARGTNGYFRHFIKMSDGTREWNSELSTIDTAILVSGALFCANYFDSSEIKNLALELYNSIDWYAAISDHNTGELYMTFDDNGNGALKLKPYNEYLILAWLIKNDIRLQTKHRVRLMWEVFEQPQNYPKAYYQDVELISDAKDHYLSNFIHQFNFFLCPWYAQHNEYLNYFQHAMQTDKLWWKKETSQSEIFGTGAGASPAGGGYQADNYNNNYHKVVSPHIMAGYIPLDADLGRQLVALMESNSSAVYSIPDAKILWRYSFRNSSWRAGDVQGIDFSTMVLGLAAHPELLGADFFIQHAPFADTVSKVKKKSIDDFKLLLNYPNPFNPNTRIEYFVEQPALVSIDIYDANGQHVRHMLDQNMSSGSHTVTWDGRDADGMITPSGTYFCQLLIGEHRYTHKMLLLR